MSNILRGVENFKSETVQELSLGKKATNWFESPACLVLKKSGNVLELGDVVLAEAGDVLFHVADGLVGLFARIRHQQLFELRIAMFPCSKLIIIIFHNRNSVIIESVIKCDLSDVLPSLLVILVSEGGVINFLDSVTFGKNSFSNEIKIFESCWEPWHLRCSNFGHVVCDYSKFLDDLFDIRICRVAFNIDEELDLSPVVVEELRWLRLDSRHVYLV